MSVTVIIDAAEAHGYADKSIDIDFLSKTQLLIKLNCRTFLSPLVINFIIVAMVIAITRMSLWMFPAMQYQSQVQQAFPNYETSKP